MEREDSEATRSSDRAQAFGTFPGPASGRSAPRRRRQIPAPGAAKCWRRRWDHACPGTCTTTRSPRVRRPARLNQWRLTFLEAAAVAVEHSHRSLADSAFARLPAQLSAAPGLTATALPRVLQVSAPAAGAALDELRQAGILIPASVAHGATAFVAHDLMDLSTTSERTPAKHPVQHPPRRTQLLNGSGDEWGVR